MTLKTILLIALGLALFLAAVMWQSPPVRHVRKRLAAHAMYEKAVSAYMSDDVEKSRSRFGEIARQFADMPIGSLSELKIAFLVYDEDHDLDRAEALFSMFLKNHPQEVIFIADSPLQEYEGELELVAYFFLGRIAQDRGQHEQARVWFDKIINKGSRNRANYIVGETRMLIRNMDAAAD